MDLINKKYDSIWDASKETIVFTGSSSIRLWSDIQDLFPEKQVINSAFGGSETIDLLFFSDDVILKYKPKKVFIYEGDNDISHKKKIKEILNSFSEIISKIKNQDTTTHIVIISPKPSISRWHLRRKYSRLNKSLRKICNENDNLEFANVWDIMIENKKLKKELFINDGLHMNKDGYELWYTVIKNYVN
ncbi:GDSL-type esterase/lipase family protein [Mariniflexile jejuense]|uniref:GDSL-type esterase/lipase family protein n=1 Tax=Mariniflexile jejuense TaxID=1173582 RepID=A0ABW3JEX8_9FLAO